MHANALENLPKVHLGVFVFRFMIRLWVVIFGERFLLSVLLPKGFSWSMCINAISCETKYKSLKATDHK